MAERAPQDVSATDVEIECLQEHLRAVYGDSERGGPVLARLGDALCQAGRLQEALGRYEAAAGHLRTTNQMHEHDDVLRRISEVRELLRKRQSTPGQTIEEGAE
ncbi:hypothetical protein A2454_02380 [Candidatus Peribacteria bacterium RIFOXYC2_FULL_55_14]|nr:MAG: hypothetical protein A2384_06625 [Candidatus Peribacteria bacterium RIFOXYB1_FULL_54_35]OGJ77481.1 MAG: hypothetical protein A2424_03965 [Candidatus Peribacteria bacterium RIFOXYC1_FULL_54_13]OGJ80106.1 MAG: hypothetical protein A2454_02380 [Candidatus Peribacteria bacterium RIFOXYC2_FULL_55_14]